MTDNQKLIGLSHVVVVSSPRVQIARDETTNAVSVIGKARRKSRLPRMLDAVSRRIAAMMTLTAAVGIGRTSAGYVPQHSARRVANVSQRQ